MSADSARRAKPRSRQKLDIPGEIKSLCCSSYKKIKQLEEYIDGFKDLATRAEIESTENYCPKCKKSRSSVDGTTDLAVFHNQKDVQEIDKLRREIDRLKKEYNVGEIDALRGEIQILRKGAQDIKDLRTELEQVRKERDASKGEIQSLEVKIARLEDEKCRLQKQVSDWQKTETSLQSENKELKVSLETDLRRERETNGRRQAEWQTAETLLRSENKELQRMKMSLETDLRREREATGRHQDQIRQLRDEIQQLRQRPRKQISLYTHTTLNPTLADQALRELMTKLRDRLRTEKVELEERPYDSRRDVTGPVVAICINVSRLGTDVQEVVKNVKTEHQNIAVMVLHHKETHALPNQSSDRILTGSDYKKLGTIIDVAFLSNKGMYSCELNTMAIERLVSFLLQYKKDI